MPKPNEVALLRVNGKRYLNWKTISVTQSGADPFPKFSFTAAAPEESGEGWEHLKLKIGDRCDVLLGGRQALAGGQITGRQTALTEAEHGLQVSGTTRSHAIVRADVDHERGEFKGYTLKQIAGAVLTPYGTKFDLKGSTDGADKPFRKVNVQAGETVFDFLERLCRFRNVHMLSTIGGDLVGYRLGQGQASVIAELQEGRNIKTITGIANYTGALSEINVIGQQPGNDQTFDDAARDVTGKVNNPALKDHVPRNLIAEMPGDKRDMQMRADHENAMMIADQVQVTVTLQGWFKNGNTLWLEHVGETVSVYSPSTFEKNHMKLAIQEATASQGPQGTITTLILVLPEAFNGRGQVDSSGIPAGFYGI